MKHYATRGMDVLREPEYMAHVQAMTAEQLHSKADIAAELAFRDIRIRDLEALIHRAHNQFENITVADTLKDAYDMAHHGVAFTDDAEAKARSVGCVTTMGQREKTL